MLEKQQDVHSLSAPLSQLGRKTLATAATLCSVIISLPTYHMEMVHHLFGLLLLPGLQYVHP